VDQQQDRAGAGGAVGDPLAVDRDLAEIHGGRVSQSWAGGAKSNNRAIEAR
jgi:hypothetical protein